MNLGQSPEKCYVQNLILSQVTGKDSSCHGDYWWLIHLRILNGFKKCGSRILVFDFQLSMKTTPNTRLRTSWMVSGSRLSQRSSEPDWTKWQNWTRKSSSSFSVIKLQTRTADLKGEFLFWWLLLSLVAGFSDWRDVNCRHIAVEWSVYFTTL